MTAENQNERKYQLKIVFGLVVIVVCASLYAYGGMSNKWLRRFLAPSICAVFLATINKDPVELARMPLLAISSSLGYGADLFWEKVLKRAYVGFSFGLSASFTAIVRERWLLVGFGTIMCIVSYIVLGVFNPLQARAEETLLAFIVYGLTIIPSIKE